MYSTFLLNSQFAIKTSFGQMTKCVKAHLINHRKIANPSTQSQDNALYMP